MEVRKALCIKLDAIIKSFFKNLRLGYQPMWILLNKYYIKIVFIEKKNFHEICYLKLQKKTSLKVQMEAVESGFLGFMKFYIFFRPGCRLDILLLRKQLTEIRY